MEASVGTSGRDVCGEFTHVSPRREGIPQHGAGAWHHRGLPASIFQEHLCLFRTKRLRPSARSAANFREGSATMPRFAHFLATGAFSVTRSAWLPLLHHAEQVSTQRKKVLPPVPLPKSVTWPHSSATFVRPGFTISSACLRTPFVTMLVPDPTSLDDEDIARAVTTRSEELTLAHRVFVDEVLRSFGRCHGAVKIDGFGDGA